MECSTLLGRHGAIVVLAAILFFGCARGQQAPDQSDLERYTFTQSHMGMEVRMLLYAEDESRAQEAADAAFTRIAELDNTFSHFQDDSELSHLNEQAGGPPVAVSDELFEVLDYAMTIAEQSGGVFDVTVGPLVDLWRTSVRTGSLPDEAAVDEARARVGWENIRLDGENQTVELLHPEMSLDLGGIAKGYILCMAADVLRDYAVDRALVEAGGDIVVNDPPPQREGWQIYLPAVSDNGRTIEVANTAVATSGDTEQYALIDGTRYSHVIDPRTGLGLTEQTMVTIVMPDGMKADALATTVSILGEQEGQDLLDRYPEAEVYLRPSPWTAVGSE